MSFQHLARANLANHKPPARLRGNVQIGENLALAAALAADDKDRVSCLYATQGRSTVAWYWDGNAYQQAAIGVSRFEGGKYLHEPQRTNRCVCYSANPAALSGITKGGDAASTLTLVDDSAALAEAGLGEICSVGNVFKLDNSAGIDPAYATVAGAPASPAEVHTASAWIRGDAGYLTWSGGGTPTNFDASAAYTRIAHTSVPVGGGLLSLGAPAGAVLYFILPQSEIGGQPSSPIVAEYSVTTRAADSLTLPLSPAMLAALAARGTFLWSFIPLGGSGTGINYYFLALDATNFFYINASNYLTFREGAGMLADVALAPVNGQAYLGAAQWDESGDIKQIGYSTDGGATWTWSDPETYAGVSGFTNLVLGASGCQPVRMGGFCAVSDWLSEADLARLAADIMPGLTVGGAAKQELANVNGGLRAAGLYGPLYADLAAAAPDLEPGQWGLYLDVSNNAVLVTKDAGGTVRSHPVAAS